MRRFNLSMALAVVLVVAIMLGAPVGAAKKQYKIGLSNFGQATWFARIARQAIINEVERRGGIAVTAVTADTPSRMSSIENFISQKVDAIILVDGDTKLVEPTLKVAKRQGIIIGSMGAGTSPSVDVAVEANDWVAGALAASELVELVGEQGNIVLIYNDVGEMIRKRKKVLEAVLTENPGVKIAAKFVYAWPDYFPDTKAKMEAILQAHPQPGEISGVYATFDGVGVAAAQAIREKGLQDHIVVVGIDVDPISLAEMSRPDSPFKATVTNDPVGMSKQIVDKVFRLLNGEKLDRRYYLIPGKLITQEDARNMKLPSLEELEAEGRK